MSHLKERAEKNCLNCNAAVQGRFCHVCGQENIEPKETFWHLISHFFNDITHFDGKFFATIRSLIFKPGFLSKEYAIGRRTKYLNPVRLYIFTSAVFFLIVLLNKSTEKSVSEEKQPQQVNQAAPKQNQQIGKIDTTLITEQSDKDSTVKINIDNAATFFNLLPDKYLSRAAYDSSQQKNVPGKKDSWLMRKIHQRQYTLNEKYYNNKAAINEAYLHELVHNFPKVFFLSLPFFALFLKLLYIRRKQFYYVNHAIFSIHLYCAGFIFLLVNMAINAMESAFHLKVFTWLGFMLFIGMMFFEYKSIRNYYQQSRVRSILKMILLNIFSFILFIFLFIALLIFSVYQI